MIRRTPGMYTWPGVPSQHRLAVRRSGTRTRGTRAHSIRGTAAARRGAAPGRYVRCITTCARCTVRRGAHLCGLVAVREERVRAVAQQPLGPAAAASESPERCVAPQPRPQRAACSTPCMARCHAGTQQCAPAETAERWACRLRRPDRKANGQSDVPERARNTRTRRFVRA